MPPRRRFPLARTIAQYLWPYRLQFTVAVLQVLLISACELLKPWPLQIVIDDVLGGKKPTMGGFVGTVLSLTTTFAAAVMPVDPGAE